MIALFQSGVGGDPGAVGDYLIDRGSQYRRHNCRSACVVIFLSNRVRRSLHQLTVVF
jgi:hypothetical protein